MLVGADVPGGQLAVAYGDVSRAVVQVEFNGAGLLTLRDAVRTAS